MSPNRNEWVLRGAIIAAFVVTIALPFVLRKEGEVLSEADETVIVTPNVVHKICNTGQTPLRLMASLSMSPVRVETPEGEAMALPWD